MSLPPWREFLANNILRVRAKFHEERAALEARRALAENALRATAAGQSSRPLHVGYTLHLRQYLRGVFVQRLHYAGEKRLCLHSVHVGMEYVVVFPGEGGDFCFVLPLGSLP